MKKLLLIDGNSIVNRAFYAMPNLTSSKGICTGGIFGFIKMLSKLIKEEKPTHIACAFDLKAPTFRHKEYSEYKAGRHPMPEELVQQIPLLKELLVKMNIAIYSLEGYEADDILGTLSLNFDGDTIIVSGDKDILQLSSEHTTVYHTKKGITDVIKYTPALLKEEGIREPINITDLKGLMGDSSDNLKGVAGVGKVTATNLISEYGDLDNIYSHIDEIKGKLQEKLINGKEDAYITKKLATIYREVPIQYTESDLEFKGTLSDDAYRALINFDFKNVEDMFDFNREQVKSEVVRHNIISLADNDELMNALKVVENTKKLCFIYDEKLSFSVDGINEYIIKEAEDLLSITIDEDYALEQISSYLNREDISVLVFDLKSMYHSLDRFVDCFKADDLLLLSYVADVSRHKTELKPLLEGYGLDASAPACSVLQLFDLLQSQTKEEGSYSVYTNIEIPLVKVLYSMEKIGFRVDIDMIDNLNDIYDDKIALLEREIYNLAGTRFNINSPKQLGEILFDKLGLPGGKKKSTSADVLEKLVYINPIVPLILEYRKIAKLRSTYIIGIKKQLDNSSRLHTIFKQALTTTGRLSSTEPNLQNIPVRTAEGKEIRKAFIASNGNKLVVSDYSQIELRLMAHMSGDERMIRDFQTNKDIHSATASAVFGVDIEDVTKEMRRKAKAVNFGIIYGISDFGLSEDIGCSVGEAREFIKKYFETYPKVKEFMDGTVQKAKECGYVQTIFGRRRIIPELNSSVYNMRMFGERAAMNMPLQGTASDIIKLAMIKVFDSLKEIPDAHLILQVHDELIVDCPEKYVNEVANIVKHSMESIVELKVPLIAETGSALNWLEAKD